MEQYLLLLLYLTTLKIREELSFSLTAFAGFTFIIGFFLKEINQICGELYILIRNNLVKENNHFLKLVNGLFSIDKQQFS